MAYVTEQELRSATTRKLAAMLCEASIYAKSMRDDASDWVETSRAIEKELANRGPAGEASIRDVRRWASKA